jgi:hypothetical protein
MSSHTELLKVLDEYQADTMYSSVHKDEGETDASFIDQMDFLRESIEINELSDIDDVVEWQEHQGFPATDLFNSWVSDFVLYVRSL